MSKKSQRAPSPIAAFASPFGIWMTIAIFGGLELLFLYQYNSFILNSIVALAGTIPMMLIQVFYPPNFLRAELARYWQSCGDQNMENPDDIAKYRLYTKSKEYRQMVVQEGLKLMSVPYVLFLLSFIVLPIDWEPFYRKTDPVAAVPFAFMFQFIMCWICLVMRIAIRTQRKWPEIDAAFDRERSQQDNPAKDQA